MASTNVDQHIVTLIGAFCAKKYPKARCYADASQGFWEMWEEGRGVWVRCNAFLNMYFHSVMKYRLLLSICGLHF